MPTNPTPPLPSNSSPVTAKTQRVNIHTANKNELEHVQKNLGDRIDELLKFCNKTFSVAPGTKTTGNAATQAGTTQAAGTPTTTVSHIPIACALHGFWAAATISGTQTVLAMYYGPAGSTPAATLTTARVRPPVAGSVAAITVSAYVASPTAGTYTVKLVNNTQSNKVTTLINTTQWSVATQNVTIPLGNVPFNAFDQLYLQIVTTGWTQASTGGLEARLYLQT